MRVVVSVTERIDSAAARALWRLLFSEPVPPSPVAADNPRGVDGQDREVKGRTEPSSD